MRIRPLRPSLAVALAALALTAACGSSTGHHTATGDPFTGPTTAVTDGQHAYLATDASGAVLIRWTVSSGVITGTVDASSLKQDVTGGQATITGTLTGDAVSFEVNGKTWTGTLDGSGLVMHVPQADGSLTTITFTAGDIDAYNAAVAALHGQGQANAQATADAQNAANAAEGVVQADRRIGSSLDDLTSALHSMTGDAVFTSDLASAATDLGTARTDYKTVQQDVSAHDCSTAGSDAATVGSDAATVDSDAATIDSDVATVESDLSQVHDAFSHLSNELDALKAASAASPGTPTQHTPAQVDAAIGAANTPIQAARAAEASAKRTVADLAATAHHVADQAEALANGCS